MKLLKQILVGAALVSVTFGAQAITNTNVQSVNIVHSADLNAALNAEQYNFSHAAISTGNFSDYISLSLSGARDLVASISGSANKPSTISFSAFDLLNSNKDLIQLGLVGNLGPRLSVGGLESSSLFGNYFIHVAGYSNGTSLYSGNISLAAPVPEAETYSMMLLGLGLMGFIARRRRAD